LIAYGAGTENWVLFCKPKVVTSPQPVNHKSQLNGGEGIGKGGTVNGK
jgi:hypothetical protein